MTGMFRGLGKCVFQASPFHAKHPPEKAKGRADLAPLKALNAIAQGGYLLLCWGSRPWFL